MKKLLVFAVMLAQPWATFAQGRVNFANVGFAIQTNFSALPYGTVGAADFARSPLRIGLFIGAAGEINPANLSLALNNADGSFAWATNRSVPFAGLFNGGNNFEIKGNLGNPISFQIRAWSLAYLTFSEAEIAGLVGTPGVWLGASTIGSVTPATGITPTPNLFGTQSGQVGAFAVYPTLIGPEPSSIALGLLGMSAILLLRRRK